MKHCPACRTSYPEDFSLCPTDGMGLVESALWSEGCIVKEKYRIVRQAGYGAMAVVYEAKHIPFDERRALKVMNEGDEEFRRRFVQEALVTRRLQHPNAVRVEDIDRAEDGRPFIVMEFIEGRNLAEVLRDGPLTVGKACAIARQIASALAAAHSLGIVHRDIKPSNLLIANTPSGEQVKVVDFGIARVMRNYRDGRHLTFTQLGSVIGTPAYMSPEQAAGKTDDELDGRSDIYSLGIVLYQMLSGSLPITSESDFGFLAAHVTNPPVPLGERCPQVPKPLASFVMSCLEKDRELRPATPEMFIESLDRVLSPPLKGPTIVVEPPPTDGTKLPATKPPANPLVFIVLGWFAVFALVEFLANSQPGFALVWLVCGAGLLAVDLVALLVRGLFTFRRAMLSAIGWLMGALAGAASYYLLASQAGSIWAQLADIQYVTVDRIDLVLVAIAFLICIFVGSRAAKRQFD